MDSDSTSNAAISSSSKDITKNEKVIGVAELKEINLAIGREQWHCQVKDTGCKEDSNKRSSSLTVLVTEEENTSLRTSKSRAKGLDIEKSSISYVNSGPHMDSPPGRSGAEKDSDDCLDDWEAFADALAAKEKLQDPPIDLVSSYENSGAQTNSRAWRPDDTSRPQCLPILLKQRTINWGWKSIMPQLPSCPICCEDFDLTDSSFLPCPCGFRLCLFCHKKILEADARCPGCRRPYEAIKGDVGFLCF